MKKLFVLIMTVVSIACLALQAAAADSVVYVTTPDTVLPGEEFTFMVNIDGGVSYLAAYVRPTFDEDVFTLVGGEWLIDSKISDFDTTLGDGVFLLDEAAAANGAVCTFTLRANEYIAVSKTTVGCEFIISDCADKLVEFISYDRDNIDVESNGVSVFGSVTSYNPQNEVEIELLKDGNVAYTATIFASDGTGIVTQEFKISGVAPGTYDLVVKKNGHLNFTITGINIDDENVDLKNNDNVEIAEITLILGDVNGDGCIDLKDVVELTSSLVYGKIFEETDKKSADINGDRCFDLKDLIIITSHKNYGKSAKVIAY